MKIFFISSLHISKDPLNFVIDFCPTSSPTTACSPKSMNTAIPVSSLKQMFSGLMSKWMTLMLCRLRKPAVKSAARTGPGCSLWLQNSMENSMQFLKMSRSKANSLGMAGPHLSLLAISKTRYSSSVALNTFWKVLLRKAVHLTATFLLLCLMW